MRRKTKDGEIMTGLVHKPGQSEQDALAEALTCLRWAAKNNACSFSQALDHSWTLMIHDRVNS